jgi:predicted transcriptional regulator
VAGGELTPHEYASKVVLPGLRALVAWRLHYRGLGQYGIARLLGVSQPMVHRYLSRDPAYYASRLAAELGGEVIVEEAVELAARMLERGDRLGFLRLVNDLTLESRYCRARGEECRAALCPGGGAHLSIYRGVLSRLLSTPCLGEAVPEVGSNLAYTPRPGAPVESIIALDGRIVRASRGSAIAAGSPRPGGSRHTASVLSQYSQLVPSLRWALALRHTPTLLGALDSMGIPLVELGRRPPAPGPGGLLAVVEPPGPGREGVVYLLSPTSEALLEAASRLAAQLCGGRR